MGRRTDFTEAEVARILRRHAEGVSMKAIGAGFGVGPGVIARVLEAEKVRAEREEKAA